MSGMMVKGVPRDKDPTFIVGPTSMINRIAGWRVG